MTKVGPKPRPVIDRCIDKFTVGDGCWEWTASTDGKGYGTIGGGPRQTLKAHRVLYEALVAPIPDGLQLDHLCRNRRCVRPAHLEPVTNRENGLRGSGPSGTHARQTHCLRGHEYTPENTIAKQSPDGHPWRECRTCSKDLQRARNRQRVAGEFACPDCVRTFRSKRSLAIHAARWHGKSKRDAVYRCWLLGGAETDDDVVAATGFDRKLVQVYRLELQECGYVENTYEKRPTPSRAVAAVWKVTPAGVARARELRGTA